MFQWNNNNKPRTYSLASFSFAFCLENTLLLFLVQWESSWNQYGYFDTISIHIACFHCLLFLFGTGIIDWCQRSWIHVYQLTATGLYRGGNTMQCLHELDRKSGWFNFSLNGVLEELADSLEHGMLSGKSSLDLISFVTFFISRKWLR